MQRLFILLFVCALLLPSVLFAHGTNFFEFAPDISERLRLADFDPASQALTVPNDFVGGIDLWTDNENAGGTFNLELRTEGGALLASKTVSTGALGEVWAGHRIHIHLPSQIAASEGATYRIHITNASPPLALYRADRNQILLHNATAIPSQVPLPAYLGETAQPFAFKYALYETQESAPPVISNASTTILGPTSVRIHFNANEPADARAAYGPAGQGSTSNTAYTGTYTSCIPASGFCSVTLGTNAGTDYQYTLFARDEWGNESSVSGTFTTPAGPPPETPPPPPPAGEPPPPPPPSSPPAMPPTILNARIVAIADTSVQVAWDTSEAANSQLTVTHANTIVAAANDPTFELTHTLISPATLTPATAYHALIRSTDLEGLSTSLVLGFTTAQSAPASPPPPQPPNTPPPGTPPPPPSTPPTPPTEPSPSPSSELPQLTVTTLPPSGNGSVGTTEVNESIRLDWSALSPQAEEGFRVDVFSKDGILAKQYTLARGSTEITISNLNPGTYKAIVYGKNKGVYTKIAEPVIFEIRGPSSFSVAARIWFTIILGGLILGTGAMVLVARRFRSRKKPEEPPRRTFLYQ